jgi:outer membrane protein assembly factor BamB
VRLLTSLSALMLVGLLGASASAEWVTRNGDAAQRGYVPISFNPQQLVPDWSVGLGSNFAVADGYVVAGHGSGIAAYDFDTGEELWRVTCAKFRELTIMDGNVFVATGEHSGVSSCSYNCPEIPYLRSYKASDGTFRFRTQFESQWYSSWGPVPYEGTLYMNGGYYGGLYRFYSSGGASFLKLAQYDEWQPAIDGELLYAYIAGNLQVVNRNSLKVIKSIPNPDYSWSGYSMRTIPVVGNHEDVFVVHDERLISFDIANGDINWSHAASFSGVPVSDGDTIYAISADALAAYDALTGTRLWEWNDPVGVIYGSMLLTKSHLFVQGASGTNAIDLKSHQSVWNHRYSGRLAFTDNRLFVGGSTFLIPEPASGAYLGIVTLIGVLSTSRRRRA